jgi:hypothetical protein
VYEKHTSWRQLLTKQLGVLASVLLCKPESNGQESLANGVVPHALAVSAILIQSLVDNIPSGAAVSVAACKVLDVVLHDINQRGVAEVAICHPIRQLRVPHEVVAVDLQLVLLRERDIAIGILEREVVLGGLGGLPLHGIFGSNGIELLVNDLCLAGLVAESQSSSGEDTSAL